jgi:hypothetical protein
MMSASGVVGTGPTVAIICSRVRGEVGLHTITINNKIAIYNIYIYNIL